MQNWVFYGIIAAIFFAFNTIIYKVAQQKGNFSPYYGSFMFGIGVMLVFGLFLLLNPGWNFEAKSTGLSVAAGALWALGFLLVAIAIYQKADVARLASIYNTNTLLTVIMGIIFLHEIPDASQIFRVVSGAILIVAGAVLVSI